MRDTRSLIVAGILLLGFVGGIAHVRFAPAEVLAPVDVGFTLASVMLIFLWYRVDSDRRGYRRPAALGVAIIALALIALPYYFFRTRGFTGGLVATLVFLALLAAFIGFQAAGEYTAYSLFPAA